MELKAFSKHGIQHVKLTHRFPRSTHTYIVEGFLATEHVTLRNQVLGRYPGFLKGLLKSPSPEVQLLSRVMTKTPGSTTIDNIKYIEELTGLHLLYHNGGQIKAALQVREVPEVDKWRLGLLSVLFDQRSDQYVSQENMEFTNGLIASLCSS